MINEFSFEFNYFQIICSRIDANPEVVHMIQSLLQERFYVPVMRSIDNSTPPIIGEPFLETQLPNVSRLMKK